MKWNNQNNSKIEVHVGILLTPTRPLDDSSKIYDH